MAIQKHSVFYSTYQQRGSMPGIYTHSATFASLLTANPRSLANILKFWGWSLLCIIGVPNLLHATLEAPPPQWELIIEAEGMAVPAHKPAYTRVHVLVTGEPEAGQVLTFFLHPYEEKYTYFLDFGDGDPQMARSRNRHLYDNPGNYRLQLFVLSEEDTVDYQRFSLNIRPSVSVTANRPAQVSRPMPSGIMPRDESMQEVRIIDHGETDAAPTNGPLIVAEESPEYPGGESEMEKFLSRNIGYPDEARDHGVEGKVVVQFVVEADGTLSNMTIIKEIGFGCESEVLRALARMPRWIPGRQNGEHVASYYVLPISFKLM